MEEKSYARRIRMPDGTLVNRYSAIDPAKYATECTCGKPHCLRARLLPFREHVAKLHNVIGLLLDERVFGSLSSGWSGALHGLRLAASIEDIEADTGYVDNPMVFALCEPTIDYENANSEMASKYVAGATIFGFCWHAYESAVGATATTEIAKLLKEERFGERGRRLLEARSGLSVHFPGLREILRLSMHQCEHGGLFSERLNRLKVRFPTEGLVLAAELSREFRNFLFHGEDRPPDHEEWGSAIVSHCRLCRFYSVSRLLLYLLQALAWIEVGEGSDLMNLEFEGREVRPRQVLESLQFVTEDIG